MFRRPLMRCRQASRRFIADPVPNATHYACGHLFLSASHPRIPSWWCPALHHARRGLKTLDVREYRPLGTPIEFRFYQRYTNHPNRQSGVQFLTHYNTHQRFRVNKDFIDYMHWGKEQGQARLPHRHQRVAFDFHDVLHPTVVDEIDMHWFNTQDPTVLAPSDLSTRFDPNHKPFSHPEHWNRMFSRRRPGEGDIRLEVLDSNSMLGPLMTYTDTQDVHYFGGETRGPIHGAVPGINRPFLGEPDRQMMQAMARPLNKSRTLVGNNGRFSKIIYLNNPGEQQTVSGPLAKELSMEIDKATNAVYSKLTVLSAAQSGQTDFFCGGLSWTSVGFDVHMSVMLRERADRLSQQMRADAGAERSATHTIHSANASIGASDTESDDVPAKTGAKEATSLSASHPSSSACSSPPDATGAGRVSCNNSDHCCTSTSLSPVRESHIQSLLSDAERHGDRADDALREHGALLWRVYTAARPLMTLVNGRCRGTGCGLALSAAYCGLTDASEFIFDGPHMGLTPYGGLTRWLARRETALKYPGLAEFVMLTGNSLFAGDALKLGWTDLFTTVPDVNYHIKQWYDASEHGHNDAVAWQLGQLLETCFHMPSHSSANSHVDNSAQMSAMERCALTPQRARWIEDAFADQPSITAVMATLSAMESLPLPHSSKSNSMRDNIHADATYPSICFTSSLHDGDCKSKPEHADASSNSVDTSMEITPFTLRSVDAAVRQLERTQLRYTLAPWDISAVETTNDEQSAVQPVQLVSELFTAYVLQRDSARQRLAVVHRDAAVQRRWRAQREREYHAYRSLQRAAHPRHVYVRLEGCENRLIEFDFTFEFDFACSTSQPASQALQSGSSGHGDTEACITLTCLKQRILHELRMPTDRPIRLGWYVVTLETCEMRNDEELIRALHTDPGVEDVDARLRYPPIYFLVKRCSLYLSEWAYAVKHQLLLASPYALAATFELLREVRAKMGCLNEADEAWVGCDQVAHDGHIGRNKHTSSSSSTQAAKCATSSGTAATAAVAAKLSEPISDEMDKSNKDAVSERTSSSASPQSGCSASLADVISMEYRYLARLMRRPDFYVVGQYVDKNAEWWAEVRELSATRCDVPWNLNNTDQENDKDSKYSASDSHCSSDRSCMSALLCPNFDAVFERDVTLDGHRFAVRPRWSPRTLSELSIGQVVSAVRQPLCTADDVKEGLVMFDPATHAAKANYLAGMLEDAGGVTVVPGLGGWTEQEKAFIRRAQGQPDRSRSSRKMELLSSKEKDALSRAASLDKDALLSLSNRNDLACPKDTESPENAVCDAHFSHGEKISNSSDAKDEREVDEELPAPPPAWRGNAHVPTNVNFYEMARHPWNDNPSSWRQDGYTDASLAYFTKQYKEAEKALYDEEGRGEYRYWPSTAAVRGNGNTSKSSNNSRDEAATQCATGTTAQANALLEERLLGEVARVSRAVEPWAQRLRRRASSGALNYPTEVATQREKIYDDEYYRWFIQPGQHPNPSGLLTGGRGRQGSAAATRAGANNASAAEDEAALESLLSSLVSSVEEEEGNFSTITAAASSSSTVPGSSVREEDGGEESVWGTGNEDVGGAATGTTDPFAPQEEAQDEW